jgi:tRNA G46 methylase TrmB
LDSLKSLRKYNKEKSKKKYIFVKNYFLNDQRKKSILEIGSGSGLFLKFFRKKKNIDYIGVESSKKFFTYLKKNFKFKNFNFINSTFPEGPSIIKKFDVIFSLNSIQQKNYKNSDSIKFIKKFVKGAYKLFKERKDGEGIVGGGACRRY